MNKLFGCCLEPDCNEKADGIVIRINCDGTLCFGADREVELRYEKTQ